MNLVAVAIVLAIVLATHPTFSFVSITVAISPKKVGAKLYFFVIAASQKMRGRLQRGHVTRCNLSATFLATHLIQDKLLRKLQDVTLTLELDSTSCNDCRDFFKPF